MKNWKIIIAFVLIFLFIGWYFMSQPSISTMAGQMIITGFRGDGTDDTLPEFKEIQQQIKTGKIGGVILFDSPLAKKHIFPKQFINEYFSSNIINVNQIKNLTHKLQKLSPQKLFIAIDIEGGNVQRINASHGFIDIISANEMGKASPQNTYNIANDLGTRLHELGINVNFAPVLDVATSNNSIIGKQQRAFSTNPDIVTTHAINFANGLSDANIGFAFKHFPGMGSATTDSHHEIADTTNSFHDYELKPWKTILPNSPNGSMVMVGHTINKNFDDVPASLSQKTISMVRNMGFDGPVITDDLQMDSITNKYTLKQSVLMAINAGNDIILFSNRKHFDSKLGEKINAMIVEMVKNGEIKKSRLCESYKRIKKYKKSQIF